jgi:uncharacterized protein (TIGR02001 family)
MSIKTTTLGAASLLAAVVFAGPALADGLPGRGKVADAPPPMRTCSTSANVGLTTDYVFRGVSQTNEDPALQGGVDLTCGNFYVGVWGSNVDFGAFAADREFANLEVDIYGGYKFTTGRISWDAGLIYYSYPGANDDNAFIGELDFLELKLSASAGLWKGGTVTGTVFFSPEYTGETGSVWTTEAGVGHEFPMVSIFKPTLSALVGHSEFTDNDFEDLSYTYWNVGLTLGFLEKWSLDVRYWDTDLDGCTSGLFSCDSRVVGTVKYTF